MQVANVRWGNVSNVGWNQSNYGLLLSKVLLFQSLSLDAHRLKLVDISHFLLISTIKISFQITSCFCSISVDLKSRWANFDIVLLKINKSTKITPSNCDHILFYILITLRTNVIQKSDQLWVKRASQIIVIINQIYFLNNIDIT